LRREIAIPNRCNVCTMSARGRIADFGGANQPHCFFELL
jgi:hypothetical protein